MSIQALKRKAVINFGSNRSGKPPGGVWLTQGPFGKNDGTLSYTMSAPGAVGFSLNGGSRNVGYVGQSMAMSKNGTPYYGQFARGSGGIRGRYPTPEPLLNSPIVRGITSGEQYKYIKPSVLSTRGMLEKKYMWIHNGQYPNYWVQPVYGNSNLSDNASQWLYIQAKAAANVCVNDTNTPDKYIGYRVRGGANGCSTTSAKYVYKIQESNAGYTKMLNIPQTASQYTLQVQRKCANPVGVLKPFPFAVNGGSGNASGNYAPPAVQQIYYNSPPEWYLK